MDNFHPIAYADKKTEPDAPRLHEDMRRSYREGFIDAMAK